MSEISLPFTDNGGDRLYTAQQIAALIGKMATNDGVVMGSLNSLAPGWTAGYFMTIDSGYCYKIGQQYQNTALIALGLSVVASTYKRIDLLVVRYDNTTSRAANATIIQGVATTGTPTAPSSVAGTDVVIGQILIDNTSGSPTFTVTDLRQILVLSKSRILNSGTAFGTLSGIVNDQDFIFTGAGSATLPAFNSSMAGVRLTFKNKGAFTSVISANAGQTIGTTSSTSFALYAQEDYVTLEWDGTSIWYVVATNGPVLQSFQNNTSILSAAAWTAIGNGLALSLNPGVYDIDLFTTGENNSGGTYSAVAIGKALVPISSQQGFNGTGASTYIQQSQAMSVKGYILTAVATIQGIAYCGGGTIEFLSSVNQGNGLIAARRIG